MKFCREVASVAAYNLVALIITIAVAVPVVPEEVHAANPHPEITVTHRGTQAPAVVHVHGLESDHDGGPHTAKYEWDFGDSGGSYNTTQGFNAAHVYRNPGTYTITLRITDRSGVTEQTTTRVTVGENRRKKVYVSNSSGNDSQSGRSSGDAVKTLRRAFDLIDNDTTLFIRNGDTFVVDETLEVQDDNVYVTTYDSGDRPMIVWDGDRKGVLFSTSSSASNVVFQDVKIHTIYEPKNESDTDKTISAFRPQGDNTAVLHVEFDDVADGVNLNGRPEGFLMQDSSALDDKSIRGYLAWIEGKDIVLLGNRAVNSTVEHIYRISGAERILIAFNTLENRDRRSVDAGDYNKPAINVQKGSYAYVYNNNVKHGPVAVGPLGDGDGMSDKGARFRYAVFRNNKIKEIGFFVEHGAEHVTFAHNTVEQRGGTAFDVDGYESSYGRGTEDITISYNSASDSSDKARFIWLGSGSEDVAVYGNLYAAPNLRVGSYNSAVVYIPATSLEGIQVIGGNIWPELSGNDNQEYHYLGRNDAPAEFRTEEEWELCENVANDSYRNINTLPGEPLTVGGITAGAGANEKVAPEPSGMVDCESTTDDDRDNGGNNDNNDDRDNDGGTNGGSNGSQGCFIATAAYGTKMEPEVEMLREFRDEKLLVNMPGRMFVKTYYALSPPLADVIRKNEVAKAVVRTALEPLVIFAENVVDDQESH